MVFPIFIPGTVFWVCSESHQKGFSLWGIIVFLFRDKVDFPLLVVADNHWSMDLEKLFNAHAVIEAVQIGLQK